MPAISTDLFKKSYTTSPKELSPAVRAFCAGINADAKPSYIAVQPDNEAQPSECFNNVAAKVDRDGGSLVYGWLAKIMEATGEPVRARHYAARAIARVRKGGDRLGEAAAYRAMALLAERDADRTRANRYLSRAYRSAAIRHSARETAMIDQVGAQIAARRGDDDRATSLARSAAAAFEAMGAVSLATSR